MQAAQVRRLVDGLIAEGQVVEIPEAEVAGWRSHVLVLANGFHTIAWHRGIELCGRSDVIERLEIEADRGV